MPSEKVRIVMSRHSAFYTPVIACITQGFLKEEGLEASYAVNDHAFPMVKAGQADIAQSAPSASWSSWERGQRDLPLHFALINGCDGFFIVARRPTARFEWKSLEGASLLADFGGQPLAMLKACLRKVSVDWGKVQALDRGRPSEMLIAFRSGEGDYIHLQEPAPSQLELDGVGQVVASVGQVLGPLTFSTLAASRQFLTERQDTARRFMRAYRRSLQWITQSAPESVAASVKSLFPDVSEAALARAIQRYKALGNWHTDPRITEKDYQAALDIFIATGAIKTRHPYKDVVYTALAE